MEMMSQLNGDLLVDILARVDGPTLASVACVCTDLHCATEEKSLWEALCHAAWPSTREARALISTTPGGFAKFYADCLPLPVYKPSHELQTYRIFPAKLVSLVDVFYDERSIFSQVMQRIPMEDKESQFLNHPFKLQVLRRHEMDKHPCIFFEEGGVMQVCNKMKEKLRLSWLVLDLNSGRAVNLSSQRPVLVQSNWPAEGNLEMRFACAIANAECVITARCMIVGSGKETIEMRLVELWMQVEDIEGVQVDKKRSMRVLARVLQWPVRSRDYKVVESGYREYEKEKRVVIERRMRRKRTLDWVWAFGAVVVFAFFHTVYSLILPLSFLILFFILKGKR